MLIDRGITYLRNMLSLRARIFIACVLPALLISTLLGSYYIVSWIENTNKNLHEQGALYSSNLSRLGEMALFSSDTDFLSVLAVSLFTDPDVFSVRILDDKKNNIIYKVAPLYSDTKDTEATRSDLVFMGAIYGGQLTAINDSEFTSASTTKPYEELLGWAEVVMTERHVVALRHQMLINTALMIAVALVVALLLSIYLAAYITRPILNMKNNISKIEAEDSSERIKLTAESRNELGDIEHAFHEMALAVNNSRFELQKKIDIATANHRDTITRLEKNNMELIMAREAMKKTNEEKSEFLARISHEIRTPIHSIIGFVNLIKRTNIDGVQSEYVRVVGHASEHLLQLINDVLEISSLQSNSIQLDNQAINLRDCIEDATLFLRPSAHKKGLELVFLIDSDVPIHVIGDQFHLKQVIINLINNAIKFTHQGDVVIAVSLLEDRIDSARLSIDVSDTGIGIAKDQLDRIHDPFFQADSSISREYEGVGLGLAIVKTLVGIMGGQLIVQSTLGEGSRFSFDIEMKKQTDRSAVPYPGDLRHKKILCFDTHPMALRSVRNQVLSWASKVYTASKLDKASELLRGADNDGQPFDLFIVGVNKKMADSETFRENLESIKSSSAAKFLLLIGDEGSRHRCMHLANERDCTCITKPVAYHYLYQSIQSLFNQQSFLPENQRAPGVTTPTVAEPMVPASNIKVLLAEDNDFNRLYVSSLLKDQGFQVSEAVTGLDAVKLSEQKRFDLIIMDIHLPDIDGLAAARKIKEESSLNRETTIIALTADVYIKNDERLITAGISTVINKPINEAGFRNIIAASLANKNTEIAAEVAPEIPTGALDDIKQRLLPRLMEELPDHNNRIFTAFINGDRDKLAEHLHQLKGVAGYFQLADLSIAASQADNYVRTTELFQLNEVRPYIQRIDEKIQAIITNTFI